MKTRTFCLNFYLAPGDVSALTALPRDIKAAYPQHRVFVDTSHGELWKHNPHCRRASGIAQAYPDVEHVRLDYGGGISGPRGQKYRAVHFLRWLHEDFARQAGLDVPVTLPRGDFHFGPDEAARPVSGRYWVLLAGGKTDIPVKAWDAARFQGVADALRGLGLGVVQLGNAGPLGTVANFNPALAGVLDLVGRTSLRDMLRILRDADGVVCGVTAAMHMAAALERPCVVLAGGREAWWWEAYVRQNTGFGGAEARVRVPHAFLHTIGVLDCVGHEGGCWKRHLDPRAVKPCLKIVAGESGPTAECMRMITVDHVMESVMGYYRDGTLPPIGAARTLRAILGDETEVDRMRSLFADAAPPPAPALVAPLEGKDGTPTAAAAPPPTVVDDAAFDDPAVGGGFTVFSLLYGDYPAMHREHLDHLAATLPAGRAELRVGSNALGPRSIALVEALVASGRVAKWYRRDENARKYPLMRAMFHDASCPIETPYLVWLDDDTICDRNPDWLRILARLVAAEHPGGARLYGPRYIATLAAAQVAWYKQAAWWRGRPLRDHAGRDDDAASKVHFSTGSFFCIATDVVRAQQVPDARLAHNGGDICIGEQVHQGGWKLADFSNNKNVVRWSGYPRRGLSEPHPGLPGSFARP